MIAGPIFTEPAQTIGDANEVPIAIPQQLFKVVVWETDHGPETLAFIYPNNFEDAEYLTGDCKKDKHYDHAKYFSSITEIEDKTGLTFPHHLFISANTPQPMYSRVYVE